MTAHATSRSLMAELPLYGLATGILPTFTEHRQDLSSAGSLYGRGAMCARGWKFASSCQPELKLRSARCGVPGFGGELKSAATNYALEQAAYYTAMDMVRSYFPADADDARAPRRFYATPPLGFAVVGYPFLAHLISLEWIGRLIVAPLSQPFVLGSEEHRAAVAALPAAPCAEPFVLDASLPWLTPAEGPMRGRVSWAVHGPVFRKLVRGDARTGDEFAAMFRVLSHLHEVLRTDATRPPALVPHVQMRYGANEVMVEMTAVDGVDCAAADVAVPGPVLYAVADAIVWLARRRIVYVDLRGPNVRVRAADGNVCLTDFDDCVLMDAPVTDVAAYAAVLATVPGDRGLTFAGRFCDGHLPAVTVALENAFVTAARG